MLCTLTSDRFWLVNTADPAITPAYCGKAYEEMCRVPYFSKFVLFARRSGVNKGILRLICSAEGKLQKTLEGREQYKELGQTNETEVSCKRTIVTTHYHIHKFKSLINLNNLFNSNGMI